MSHVGTGCLIAGFLTLAAVSGSVSFPTILSGHVVSGPLRDVLFALFFLGFGVKAGVIPLHVWLPEAHPSAPTNISALMSGVLIKAGIYGMVRVCAFGLGVPSLSWGVFVVAVGGLSAVLGVLYALMQHDLKRLLAYHSIENIGIILLGLGRGDDGLDLRAQRRRVGGDRGQPVPRAESRGVQGPAVSRRGERGDGDGHAADRAVRRPAATDAVDRPVLPGRRDGDFRSAALQRLRERVADVSGVPVRVPQLCRAADCLPVSRGRRPAGAHGGAGRGLFREGVRHQFPGAAAERRGCRGARIVRR